MKSVLSGGKVLIALVAFATSGYAESGVSHPVPPPNGRFGVFEEPLTPLGKPSAYEVGQLRIAIEAYRDANEATNTRALEKFLSANPNSVYRASLWLDIGLARLHEGMDTAADGAFEAARLASMNARTNDQVAVNQRAVAELLFMHSRLGHPDRLDALLSDVNPRDPRGIASPAASIAKIALQDMRDHPETTKECGWIALQTLLQVDRDLDPPTVPGNRNGFSLQDLIAIARGENRAVVAIHRDGIPQPIPVPSVVHWRSGHFANIVEAQGERFLVRDPTQRGDRWLNRSAVESESSGYFLVDRTVALKGPDWAVVDAGEASQIRGGGFTNGPDPHGKPCQGTSCCTSCSGPGGSSGMPSYGVNPMLIGVILQDTPLSYKPPLGPSIDFQLTYNQKDADQPSTFTFGNVGPKWAFNWIEYIQDDPAHIGTNVMLYLPDGQGRLYSGYNATTQTFSPEPQTGANLVRVSTSTYERRMPDGSKEVFSASDGSSMYPRRIFLTHRIDPQGHSVTLGYDIYQRLSTITDLWGRVSTLQYGVSGNMYLVSGINDPFGRHVTLAYDSNGRLSSITDAIGMTSTFGYTGDSTIQDLTTPYGTTHFEYVANGYHYTLDITDVLGNVSRYEFSQQYSIPNDPASLVPSGMPARNAYLAGRNSFYWDAEAFLIGQGDWTKARIQHWEHVYNGGYQSITSDVLESVKYPNENRIWYAYPDGPPQGSGTGSLNQPSDIGRVLADGTTQLTKNQYNSYGKVTQSIDATGLETDTMYDSNNIDPIQIDRYGAGGYHTVESFTYNTQHEVLTHTDEAGKVTTYTYNPYGQLTSITDPLGHATTYIYDTSGFLTSVTDANGHSTSYTYDPIGRVATETDAALYTKTYIYDALNRVTRINYWDGTYEVNTFDKLDRVAHRDRLGHTTNYTFDAMRNLRSETDPLGNVVASYTYYRNNTLKTRTDGTGGTTTWIRDLEGRVTGLQDPNGGITSYAYDVANRKTSETNALKQVTNYLAYDLDNRLLRSKDVNGVITDRTYHPRGWPLTVTTRANADGSPSTGDSTATRSYDAVGKVISIVDPDGVATTLGYDDAHRLTSVGDALGNSVEYMLDPVGNRRGEDTYDSSHTPTRSLSRTFEARNLVITQTDGLGHTKTFDYDGNRESSSQTDRLGVATSFDHDAERRLTALVQDVGGSDPSTADATTAFGYDASNRVVSITDPNTLVTAYIPDATGRTTLLASPDTGDTHYTYDVAGNKLTETDNRGVTSTYAYDEIDRMTSTTFPDSSLDIAYAYDESNAVTGCASSYPIGRLTTVNYGFGTTRYCYDKRGNVVRKSEVVGGTTLVTQYTYTLANRLASITFPSGAVVTYTRDLDGHINRVTRRVGLVTTTLISNATYYPFGPLKVLTYGNGRTLTKTYDANYGIDRISSSVSSGLNYKYDLDAEGDIVGITPTGGTVQNYDYDALYRLTTVAPATGFYEAYTYNKTGDRLSAALNNGSPIPYAYASGTHHLSGVGTTTRSYDDNGNTESGITPSLTLTYNDRNRLATATSGLSTTTYTYNAYGERVRKQGAATTLYSYNEAGQLLGEYSAAGGSQVEYIYLSQFPIAVAKSSGVAYVETDHLATPRVIFNPSTNTPLWTWNMLGSAFGTNAPNQAPSGGSVYPLNLRFPGQYFDVETGLSYNIFRDYEPGVGRYIEADPIGLNGGSSIYSYVNSKPISATDPFGLSDIDEFNDCMRSALSPDDCLHEWAMGEAEKEWLEGCAALEHGSECLSWCILTEFVFGDTYSELAGNIIYEGTHRALERYADEVANRALAKALPVVGWFKTAWDAGKTIYCTWGCVEK
jgi:RHS repeat-associated protein